MNLSTATPAEIDTELDSLQFATAKAQAYLTGIHARIESERKTMHDYAKYDYYQTRGDEAIAKLEAAIPAAEAAAEAAYVAEAPFHAEYRNRGGWTRAYLVITSGRGHVHRTTSCTTCYVTTQFNRMSMLSGMDEQEIVDAAGERACTVCYASAPVELRLDRPTSIFSKDEVAAQQARTEREAKSAAAKAQEIVVPSYYDHGSYARTHVFKTVRGATNAIAGNLSSLTWYGTGHPSANQWLSDVQSVRDALAAKGVDYDYDKALAAARKKTTKEGVASKF